MSEATPVQDAPTPEATAAPAEATKPSQTPSPASPAQDLRDIQALLVGAIFPGNMAPAVVKAYQLLEMMAKQVESESK